jgi:hypothetical protein
MNGVSLTYLISTQEEVGEFTKDIELYELGDGSGSWGAAVPTIIRLLEVGWAIEDLRKIAQ